jgi:hypothetical protein
LLQSDLFGWRQIACRMNRFVRFDEDVIIVALFAGKRADDHKHCASQQAGQHNSPVGALVSVVKSAGHGSHHPCGPNASPDSRFRTLLIGTVTSANFRKIESTKNNGRSALPSKNSRIPFPGMATPWDSLIATWDWCLLKP